MNTKKKYYKFRELYILTHINQEEPEVDKEKKIKIKKESELKKEIINILGISERTYIRYLQQFDKEKNNFINDYLFTIAHSDTKDIAAYNLNLSRKGLFNKEKELFKNLIPFFRLNNLPDDKIINILNIQKKVLNNTPTTVSFDDLKKQIEDLKKYIVILANPIEKEIIDNDIKTILKKLESLKKISNKIFNDTIKKTLP